VNVDAETRARVGSPTFEDVVEHALRLLVDAGALARAPEVPWASFYRLSALVHDGYEIPSTTITPIMRRLLFAIGVAATPANVVGAGTFVGYSFSWLIRDRADPAAAPFVRQATGIDVDRTAIRLARRNCRRLNHGRRLRFICSDARDAIRRWSDPIDLLYLDVDDPTSRKQGYVEVLQSAIDRLRPGCWVLAHDPCVEKFCADFVGYHAYVRESGRFGGPWVLNVDPCGLSIAVVK
jgi:predicted O-methyltransferase YrrM